MVFAGDDGVIVLPWIRSQSVERSACDVALLLLFQTGTHCVTLPAGEFSTILSLVSP